MSIEKALKQADAAARRGDLAEAERWSKAAERMTQVAEKLAAHGELIKPQENEEELRAELRRRLERFVAADHEIQRWDCEMEAFHAAIARGENPPPLRPHPAGPMGEEAYLVNFLNGPEPND